MLLSVLLPIIFIIGIILIAMEDKTKINKAAIATGMAIIMWGFVLSHISTLVGVVDKNVMEVFIKNNNLLGVSAEEGTYQFFKDILLIDKLGEVATTIFFVMATMVIIELIDNNGGFRVITENIKIRDKRKLLWVIAFLSFFISALLDNIAAAVVIIALLRKLLTEQKDRWIFACTTIIAANAGGSWSPIGDVTTILLWSSKHITALHQISYVFIPALVNMAIPVYLATKFFKKGEMLPEFSNEKEIIACKRKYFGGLIMVMGVLSLAMVPVFTELTGLPPFMGVLFGLTILWIFTDSVYGRAPISEHHKMSVIKMFARIDMATIMFFFGILMSVAAIDSAGILKELGDSVSGVISEPLLISFIVGICSSFVDNVALVAATMGMYPLADASAVGMAANFVADSEFWTFLAYCGVTGGSILIIGSATGVTVMGMEGVSFMYYLKRFSLLALAGYIAGAACFLVLNVL